MASLVPLGLLLLLLLLPDKLLKLFLLMGLLLELFAMLPPGAS
jgi:hypothetical protein